MTDRRIFQERLDAGSMQKCTIPPGCLASFASYDNPSPNAAPLADSVDFELMVGADGVAAPGILLKDANGRAVAGIQVTHIELIDLGRRIHTAGLLGFQRIEQQGLATDEYKEVVSEQYRQLLDDVYPDHQRDLVAKTRREVAVELKAQHELEIATLLETLKREATREVMIEHAEKISSLALAANSNSKNERIERMRDLRPWIQKVVELADS